MTTDLPPTPRGQNTRLEILRAAHALFLTKGYHGTSMRMISREAGIALGGIYNHFNSKEAIFRSVLIESHPYREILPALASAHHDDIEALLRQAWTLIDDSLNNRPDLINLIFIEQVEFHSRHMPELLNLILPQVGSILTRFSESGEGLRPYPLPIILRSFIATALGYFLTRNALGEDTPPEFRENAFEHFIDIYLHGILIPEPNP